MLGWCADLFRIFWGFLYWNSRKSVYRWSGRRVPCPCQNPSDSGRGGETGCDPALNFAKPVRFRTVCPLLKPAANGRLMCSVDAEKVRPFWGRFLVVVFILIALFYGSVVLLAFGVMRQVGYPVTIGMIAWPPAWSEIDQVRSRYFLNNAQHAYRTGDLSGTVMSLSLAYDYDPYNYEAGFFLARLWQAGRPEVSNHLYQELIANHPEHRTRTAQAWLRSLLPRADYVWIEKLAGSALRFSDDHVAAWLHALLYANRHTQDETVFTRLLSTPETLSPGVETVLKWEQNVRTSPPPAAREILLQSPPAGSPDFVVYYQIRRLITLGFPVDALDLLNANETVLSGRDRVSLQLHAFSAADFRRSYSGLFDQLSRLSPSLAQLEIIAAHLIAHPDREFYQRTKSRISPQQLTVAEEQLPGLLALFCLAGAHGDTAYQMDLAEQMRTLTNSRFVVLNAMIALMAQPDNPKLDLHDILPALQPLSLDLTYALLERYESTSP